MVQLVHIGMYMVNFTLKDGPLDMGLVANRVLNRSPNSRRNYDVNIRSKNKMAKMRDLRSTAVSTRPLNSAEKEKIRSVNFKFMSGQNKVNIEVTSKSVTVRSGLGRDVDIDTADKDILINQAIRELNKVNMNREFSSVTWTCDASLNLGGDVDLNAFKRQFSQMYKNGNVKIGPNRTNTGPMTGMKMQMSFYRMNRPIGNAYLSRTGRFEVKAVKFFTNLRVIVSRIRNIRNAMISTGIMGVTGNAPTRRRIRGFQNQVNVGYHIRPDPKTGVARQYKDPKNPKNYEFRRKMLNLFNSFKVPVPQAINDKFNLTTLRSGVRARQHKVTVNNRGLVKINGKNVRKLSKKNLVNTLKFLSTNSSPISTKLKRPNIVNRLKTKTAYERGEEMLNNRLRESNSISISNSSSSSSSSSSSNSNSNSNSNMRRGIRRF